jgi:hypothetical protein
MPFYYHEPSITFTRKEPHITIRQLGGLTGSHNPIHSLPAVKSSAILHPRQYQWA